MGYLQSCIIIFVAKVKLSSHSDIVEHLNIIKYLKITSQILKNVKLRKKNGDLAFFAFLFQIFVV